MKLKLLIVLLCFLVIIIALLVSGAEADFQDVRAAQYEESGKLVIPVFVRSSWPLNTEIFRSVGAEGSCYWYDWVDDGHYDLCPDNVRVPAYWTLYWENRKPCWAGSPYITGQPEARLTDPIADIGRGESALWFTFWRCQDVRMTQTLPEGLWGDRVKAVARVQIWYSDCSEEPFGLPLHSDCVTPYSGDMEVRVGVASQASTWTDDVYCDGSPCWHTIESPWVDVPVTGGAMWIQTRSDWPAKHENVYVESITLEVWDE